VIVLADQGVGDLVGAGPLLLAVPVAIAAGALSFFSPCCLPLVPGYLSYVAGMTGAETDSRSGPTPGGRAARRERPAPDTSFASRGSAHVAASSASLLTADEASRRTARRTLVGTALFVLGFAAVFTSYGAAFGGFGFALQRHQVALTRALGAVTVLLGLMFLGLLARVPLLRASSRTMRSGYRPAVGLAGAPLLGVLFGIGWTPCIGPTLAAVLTLASTTGTAGRGAVLAFAYAAGLGVPFLLVAAAFERMIWMMSFARRHAGAVMRFGGGMLVAVGLLQLTGLWGQLIVRLQTLISGTTLPL
jgi:cytochrome c-type biogenesis protein